MTEKEAWNWFSRRLCAVIVGMTVGVMVGSFFLGFVAAVLFSVVAPVFET